MTIHLKDIIDLDYLLSVDDQRDSGEERETTLARDREIFNQLDPPGMDDTRLLFSWLEYRRLVFFHEAEDKARSILPGTLFASLYRWSVYGLLIAGFLSGICLAYSFLAYHGTRPVNVTLFFVVFILLQVLLSGLTLFMLAVRFVRRKIGAGRNAPSLVHALLSAVFFKGLPGLLKKIKGGEKGMASIEYIAALIQMRNREYKDIFFWPFFRLSSFFSISFSLGALGGTLFRVTVSDLAFGWQSTLVTASVRIHGALSMIALPWSWFVPQDLALPSHEQIEGSRILLKEGISSLATKDLVSWWPFLCLGIVFYAILPRLVLIMASVLAQKKALVQFDFEKPRFKKLLVQMQSPIMDIRSEAPSMGRQPDSSVEPGPQMDSARQFQAKGARALVLASGSVYGADTQDAVIGFINQQLCVGVTAIIPVSFDYSQDRELLVSLTKELPDQIIVLQEVWQPPIRGLLYYFVQLKTQVFADRPLWILLTQTPGEKIFVVDSEDVNFQVWKRAIHQLGNPDILLERVYK
ncbi:MAG: DUF2868 domain-containing protein [Proteobacteria bacterium]|nr:DUF2868 domain-containing protein [Pseudomonadota bacterium]